MDLNSLIGKIGLGANLTQDIVLILAIALSSFIFGILIGRYRLITVLINIYVVKAILTVTPEKYLSNYTYELAFFIGLVILLTLFGKSLFEIHISGAGSGFLWRVFAMSFIEIAMLMSILLSLMPKKIALTYVSQAAYGYLASPNAQFFWMVLPLVFIFIIHRRLNR